MRFKAALAVMALTWGTLCFAQSYPSKHITVVVPASPGGALDAIARVLGDEMGKSMGQTIVVENKPGGGGMLGAQAVARAQPDGHTVLLTNSSPLLNMPLMVPNVPYDVRRDFAFITQIATGSLVLAANKDVPAKTMEEFLSWAAQNKGSVSYGSYGVGAFGHLASAFLDQSKGLGMIHVPYKGEAPMIQDLLGSQIHWGLGSAGALGPHLKTGRVRALAVLGAHRLKNLPDVPTMAEAGFTEPEYNPVGWVAMVAPAGTPAPIIERLEKEARAAIGSAQLTARLEAFGLEPMGSTAAEFRRDFEAAVPVIERMIKASGAKLE